MTATLHAVPRSDIQSDFFSFQVMAIPGPRSVRDCRPTVHDAFQEESYLWTAFQDHQLENRARHSFGHFARSVFARACVRGGLRFAHCQRLRM